MAADAITNMLARRSVRAFDPSRRIADQDLRRIAEAGIWAPSGKNRQATVVLVIRDPALRSALSELNCRIGGWDKGFDPFYGAPVIMAVVSKKGIPTAQCDGSVVLENIMLAASALGISSCWIHRAREEFETPLGHEILKKAGLQGEWEGIGHAALGYAKDPLPAAHPRLPGRIVEL
ncbi:MAG: nitroreductase family protein [Succinivibrio sp.]